MRNYDPPRDVQTIKNRLNIITEQRETCWLDVEDPLTMRQTVQEIAALNKRIASLRRLYQNQQDEPSILVAMAHKHHCCDTQILADVLFSESVAVFFFTKIRETKTIVYFLLCYLLFYLVAFFLNFSEYFALCLFCVFICETLFLSATIPLYNIAMLNILVTNFTTLYLVMHTIIILLCYSTLQFQIPRSATETVALTFALMVHFIGDFVKVFADAYPPDVQDFKMYLNAFSCVQYMVFAAFAFLSPHIILFAPVHTDVQVSIGIMNVSLTETMTSSLCTLALFFGKFAFITYKWPNRCATYETNIQLYLDQCEYHKNAGQPCVSILDRIATFQKSTTSIISPDTRRSIISLQSSMMSDEMFEDSIRSELDGLAASEPSATMEDEQSHGHSLCAHHSVAVHISHSHHVGFGPQVLGHE